MRTNIDYIILAAFIIAFAITLVVGRIIIPILRKRKVSQIEKEQEVYVEAHLEKAGTPTMGGVIFLIGAGVAAFIAMDTHPMIFAVMVMVVGFGLIGFIDDFRKVALKLSDGIKDWQKFALQCLFTTYLILYIIHFSGVSLEMIIPFTHGQETIDLGIFAIPFAYLVVLATVNAVNFTDGLDGLASSVTSVVAVFFTAASIALDIGIAPAGSAMLGGLLAFLCYNAFPARIFMGDTGSLALGGFVVAMAYLTQTVLFIPIVGIIYVMEILSVVIQVSYYKITHGKRIFKMTPIHHHFELCGWSETRIVTVFTVITIIACAVGFYALV